jgi:transcriptional regulator with XRE-family HTH domain
VAYYRMEEDLRRMRQDRGISQEALSICSGVSVSTIRNLEQGGRSRLETIRKLQRTLYFGGNITRRAAKIKRAS